MVRFSYLPILLKICQQQDCTGGIMSLIILEKFLWLYRRYSLAAEKTFRWWWDELKSQFSDLFSVSDLSEARNLIWEGKTPVSYGKNFWHLFWIISSVTIEERKKKTKKAAHWMSICVRRAESYSGVFFFVVSSILALCKGNLRKWCLYNLFIYIHFWTDVCFEDLATIKYYS